MLCEEALTDDGEGGGCGKVGGPHRLRGFANKTKFQKSEITMEVGGWVGQGLTLKFFFGKSSQNSSKPVLIFWSSIPCVLCLYIHCYKLLVIMIRVSFHVNNGFPKKKVWMGGGGGWGELYPRFFFGFLEFF